MTAPQFTITSRGKLGWKVQSLMSHTVYTVDWNFGELQCSCPHFWYRCRGGRGKCKHVAAVEMAEKVEV